MENELKREIILENFQNPFNKEVVSDESYKKINSRNPNCIDNLDFYILFDKDIIKDIKFMGEAWVKNLIGKTIKEAKDYINNFHNMCNELDYDEEKLNEGVAFSEIYKQSNRKHCALLPYNGILKAILDYENK